MIVHTQDRLGHIIRSFLAACTLFFYAAAFLSPDRGEMVSGLLRIIMSPAQVTRDYFHIGSISGSFLNMALVATVLVALMYLPNTEEKGITVTAYFLCLGFTTWGINILNIWPFLIGVFLNAKVRKVSIASTIDIAMFATGLCPLVSEMLFRYPGTQVHGFTAQGVLLALLVGGSVGFLTPALAAHSPNIHKGFNLYSAAMASGFMGFFFMGLLYKSRGITAPESVMILGPDRRMVAYTFFGILFVCCILLGWVLNGKSFHGYGQLLHDTGHRVDFAVKYGSGLSIMNFGFYGLFIILYYTLIGAQFNGVTCGIIFCMSCFGATSSHARNVWPIMLGYLLASIPGVNEISSQPIVIGFCYASGLGPITGVYGWWAGLIAGAAHYVLVTSVPLMHGGFCLHNGGFTAVMIAMLMVPQLETFCTARGLHRAAETAPKNHD